MAPPRATLRAQNRAFDIFLEEYNRERPHEAHDQSSASPRRQPIEHSPESIGQRTDSLALIESSLGGREH